VNPTPRDAVGSIKDERIVQMLSGAHHQLRVEPVGRSRTGAPAFTGRIRWRPAWWLPADLFGRRGRAGAILVAPG